MNREVKRICEAIEKGESRMYDLVNYYTTNYTILQMTETLASVVYELYKREKEAPTQIPITREDFIKLRNIFRIKGYRILPNGNVVAETRGGQRYDLDTEE